MAEVTYYFDAWNLSAWTAAGNMVDGILTNYAYTSKNGDAERLSGNTCPGTDFGEITKVELRAYGYGDGNDQITLTPDFPDEGDEHPLTMSSSASWSAYADITTDTNAPSPWTWTNVKDLILYGPGNLGGVVFSKVGKGNTMYCAKVEIRVTYTEAGAYYQGLKVQGVGDLALCDVGSNPLRIRKGGVTYGIELVDVDDPNASKIRIKTGAGIKAIRKYT